MLTKDNYTSIPLSAIPNENPMKVACYYSWNHMKNGSLSPDQLDVTVCTHILMGFASVVNSTLLPSEPGDIKGYLLTTSLLKKKNPKLKVMLSAGGGYGFSEAVGSANNRTKFINSIIQLLKECNFDGFDIDWEFPAWNGEPAVDRTNFVYFLRDFHQTISENEQQYLISVAVGAPKTIIDVSYDIPGIAKYVDFVNLMSYDYHDYTALTPFTGHNSPLFSRSVEQSYFATLNTAWSASYWVQKGMPRNKVLVGIPTYTHNYVLAVRFLHGFDAPAKGSNGEYDYAQVCQFLKNGGTRVFDTESQVPYGYHNVNWVAFDDYQSVTAKAKWIKKMGFGGAMTFDLNCDDWQGSCDGNTKFPLHKIVRDILL